MQREVGKDHGDERYVMSVYETIKDKFLGVVGRITWREWGNKEKPEARSLRRISGKGTDDKTKRLYGVRI